MSKRLALGIFAVLAAACATAPKAPPPTGVDADDGVAAFRAGDFAAASGYFCNAVKGGGDVAESQVGLARSLEQTGFVVASIHAWHEILVAGGSHPYFDKAVEALAGLGVTNDDDALIGPWLDTAYTSVNAPALQKMNPAYLQMDHYVLGVRATAHGNKRDSQAFLATVKPGSPAYARAQELLAITDFAARKQAAQARVARAAPAWRNAIAAERAKLAGAPPVSPCVATYVAHANDAVAAALDDANAPATPPAATTATP